VKQSQVKPGVRAMLSLGHRGAVAVTVVCQWRPERAGDVRWCVRDSSGVERTVTPRRLQPMPAPYVATASERTHASAFRCASDAMAQVIHLMSV
jgi:hypothetical protein